MATFADTLRALNSLKTEGLIEEYAVTGAMAMMFWTDPVPTYDLDVLVFLGQPEGSLVTSTRSTAGRRREATRPTRSTSSWKEFRRSSFPPPTSWPTRRSRLPETLDYEGVPVRVVRPEYLIALYSEPAARTPKRRERAAALLEWPHLDRNTSDDILGRHGLEL